MEVLHRFEIDIDRWYPVRCGRDRCRNNAKYRFVWADKNITEEPDRFTEAYCSFECFIKDAL